MKIKYIYLCLLFTNSAHAELLHLSDVLNLSEKNSAAITVAESAAQASKSAIRIARSSYFPTINLEAIDSSGFAGSNGQLGIGGLMGSPYRSGIAYGVVGKLNVWDFGRTSNAVSSAEHSHLAHKEEILLQLQELDDEATHVFFDCVRYQSQKEAWGFVMLQAKAISQEVRKFVATGQKSAVEKYLAESQEQEAITATEEFTEKTKAAEHRLALFTGKQQGFSCPNAEQLNSGEFKMNSESHNPILAKTQEEIFTASDLVSKAKAGNFPQITALASYGSMEKSRLVPKKDMAVGIGINFPIFEGFKTSAQIQEAKAQEEGKIAALRAYQEKIERTEAKYDEAINAISVQKEHLQKELSLAQEAFQLGRSRFEKMQGSLVDLREALKNLSRVKIQLNDAIANYWSFKISKELFAGRRLNSQEKVNIAE